MTTRFARLRRARDRHRSLDVSRRLSVLAAAHRVLGVVQHGHVEADMPQRVDERGQWAIARTVDLGLHAIDALGQTTATAYDLTANGNRIAVAADEGRAAMEQRPGLLAALTAIRDLPAGVLLVGGLARFALSGRNPGGLLGAVLVGVAGSFLASFVGERIGWYQAGDTAGFVMSAAGAITLLAIFRFLAGTSKPSSRRDDSFDS